MSGDLRERWDELEVDGIPVGDGYGIEIAEVRDPLSPLSYATSTALLGAWALRDIWLTHLCRDEYLRVRKLNPYCVVTARRGDRRIIVDQGRPWF